MKKLALFTFGLMATAISYADTQLNGVMGNNSGNIVLKLNEEQLFVMDQVRGLALTVRLVEETNDYATISFVVVMRQADGLETRMPAEMRRFAWGQMSRCEFRMGDDMLFDMNVSVMPMAMAEIQPMPMPTMPA